MQNAINNIMVVVDFSRASLNAAKTAVRMCQRHGAQLHLLTVHETEHLFPMGAMQAPLPALSEELMQAEDNNLQAYARAIRKHSGIECTAHHVPGLLVDTIVNKATETECDMLVLGSGFRQRNVLFGNTARRIVKALDCPVLIMPFGAIDSFKRIVMPVRAGSGALDKLSLTHTLARKNRASVHVVGVFGKRNDHAYGEVKRMVARAYGNFSRSRIDSSYEVNFGKDMAGNVIKACKDSSADLVVISASAVRSLKQLFFCDYVREMINHEHLPVLCVPSGELSRKQRPFTSTHSMLA